MSSRVFKLFLSSTFGDFQAEREALRERVWPKLEHFCKAQGAAFQVVDLRWGVSEADGLSHDTLRICLDEVARCRKISPKPNFVMLIGDRYGWRPLPAEIPADELEEIISQLDGSPEKIDLLNRWYRRDDNAIPPHYRLLPRSADYASPSAWTNVETQLTAILRDAARTLGMTPDRRERYFLSATHLEIVRGTLAVSDADEHVLAIFRNIDGIEPPSSVSTQVARFTDVVNGTFDEEAASLRAELRTEVIQTVPDPHRFNYRCQWIGENDRPISTSHIDDLCADVERSLLDVITRELEAQEGDALDQETARHAQFAKERAETFIGRENEIEQLQKWLKQTLTPSDNINEEAAPVSSFSQLPLLVHGPGGVGKSAFMARALAGIEHKHPDAVVIRRFIGASPRSVDLLSFVGDLLQEISRRYGQAEHLPEGGLKELLEELPIRLSWATQNRPLILAIDALDQFSESLEARHHLWLPQALTQNVALVMSVIDGSINDTAHRKYPETVSISIPSFSRSEGGSLLDALLRAGDDVAPERKRCLSSEQRAVVLDAFAADGRPLYIKIASNFVRRWPSWIEPERLPDSLEGLIRLMVKHLREVHGANIADRALDYLSASRFGVSDDEIRDLLWRDEEAHAEFDRRKNNDQPAVDTLPPVIWSRIYADLAPYLTAQSIDGMLLYRFYHRGVGEEIAKDCLADDELLVHSRLAKYFADQPLLFGDGAEKVPNLRKLMEEPWQWIMAGELDKAEALITNFDFAMAKCRANRFDDLLDDMRLLVDKKREMQQTLPSELAIWNEFYRIKAHILRRGNDAWPAHKILLQLAAEYADGTPIAQSADEWLSQGMCDWVWLRDLNRSGRPYGDAALAVLEGHAGGISGVLIATNNNILSWSDDGTLRLWSGNNRDSLCVLEGHTGAITGAEVLADGRILSWSTDKTLRLWDGQNGASLGVLRGHKGAIIGVQVFADGRIFSWSTDKTLRLWDGQCGASLAVFGGHTHSIKDVQALAGDHILSWSTDGAIHFWNGQSEPTLDMSDALSNNILGVQVLANGHVLSWSKDFTLCIRDGQSGMSLTVLEGHAGLISGVQVLADGRILSWSKDKTLRLWNGQSGDTLVEFTGHNKGIRGGRYLANGRILSWSKDKTLRLWNGQSGETLAVLKGHTGAIKDIQVLVDGRILSLSEDRTMRFWDGESGAPLGVLGGHTGGIIGVQVLEDGRILSWSTDKTLRLWDGQSGASLAVLGGHTNSIKGVQVLADGNILSWSTDGIIRFWNGQREPTLDMNDAPSNNISGVKVLADGRVLSWSKDFTLCIRDGQSSTSLAVLEGHTGEINGVRILADNRILSWSKDQTSRLWNSLNGDLIAVVNGLKGEVLTLDDGRILTWSTDKVLRIWDCQSGKSLAVLKGHTGLIKSVQILANGRILSLAMDNTLRLWNGESGAPLGVIGRSSEKVNGVRVLSDNRILTWHNSQKILRIWDVKSGGSLVVLKGHTSSIKGAQALVDGRILSWSSDKTLRLWDGQSGASFAVLGGHTNLINGVQVLADGRILSWSTDKTLRLWDGQSGAPLSVLEGHTGAIIGVQVLADGRILSWSTDKTLRLWSGVNGEPVVEFKRHTREISEVKVLADGRVISWSDDGEVVLWDASTGTCIDQWGNELLHVMVDALLREDMAIIPSAIFLPKRPDLECVGRVCWADDSAKTIRVITAVEKGMIAILTASNKLRFLKFYQGANSFSRQGVLNNSNLPQGLNVLS